MRDLTCELEEIRASVLAVSIAADGTGQAIPTNETIALALLSIVHRLDQILEE